MLTGLYYRGKMSSNQNLQCCVLVRNSCVQFFCVEVCSGPFGSIQYASVITRPDIAFAASRLARHNTRPGPMHDAAADHVLHYLKNTRDLALEYDGNRVDDGWTIASDASFADNY
jgi:hypothetical protein